MNKGPQLVGCDAEDCVHNNRWGICLFSRIRELSQPAEGGPSVCAHYQKREEKKEAPVEAEEELYADTSRVYMITWRRGRGEKRIEAIVAVSADQAYRISVGELEIKSFSKGLIQDAPWKHGEGWSVADIRERNRTWIFTAPTEGLEVDDLVSHLSFAASGKKEADKPPEPDTYTVLLQCQNCGMLSFATIPTGIAVCIKALTVRCPRCGIEDMFGVCWDWWAVPPEIKEASPELDWTK